MAIKHSSLMFIFYILYFTGFLLPFSLFIIIIAVVSDGVRDCLFLEVVTSLMKLRASQVGIRGLGFFSFAGVWVD